MIEIAKPKITPEENESTSTAKFIVEPLERGFGITIGNSLRRILLSSLPGAAAIGIKIAGVTHEFTSIHGVREDVAEIILNIKGLHIKAHTDDKDFKSKMTLVKSGAGEVFASDISFSSDIEILNPEHHICTLEEDGAIDMEIFVGVGRGYVSADFNKESAEKRRAEATDDLIGFIAVDSIYTPVVAASYNVEQTRVGQNIDFDKLILEVKTDGTASPREMVSLAAKILVEHANEFVELVDNMRDKDILKKPDGDSMDKIFEKPVEELELSARSYNCLKRANIHTVEDLTKKTYEDMLKVRNLGQKSLDEIVKKLADMNLCLAKRED